MKNFCSKWKYELVCILMELLQGKSITSVIKGIVHLTVMRKGPTLHVSVVLQSFYFKSFLLFRRTEAGFESRKEFSRTFFFFLSKRKSSRISARAVLSVLLFWVFIAFVCPLLPSQSPWSVCPSSHTVLPKLPTLALMWQHQKACGRSIFLSRMVFGHQHRTGFSLDMYTVGRS